MRRGERENSYVNLKINLVIEGLTLRFMVLFPEQNDVTLD